MRIILDTNFLIDVIRFKIDLGQIPTLILGQCELFTLDSVMDELKKIAKTKARESGYAKIALELIKNKKIRILKIEGKADEVILSLSEKNTIVATNDKELKKLLKRKGVKTIYIKSKKHLDIN